MMMRNTNVNEQKYIKASLTKSYLKLNTNISQTWDEKRYVISNISFAHNLILDPEISYKCTSLLIFE